MLYFVDFGSIFLLKFGLFAQQRKLRWNAQKLGDFGHTDLCSLLSYVRNLMRSSFLQVTPSLTLSLFLSFSFESIQKKKWNLLKTFLYLFLSLLALEVSEYDFFASKAAFIIRQFILKGFKVNFLFDKLKVVQVILQRSGMTINFLTWGRFNVCNSS